MRRVARRHESWSRSRSRSTWSWLGLCYGAGSAPWSSRSRWSGRRRRRLTLGSIELDGGLGGACGPGVFGRQDGAAYIDGDGDEAVLLQQVHDGLQIFERMTQHPLV